MNDAVVHRREQSYALVDDHARGESPVRWRFGAVIRRHKLLIASCTTALVATTAYFTSRLTPTYEASASIRIEQDDSRLGDLGMSRATTPNELPTEIEILRSRALTEAVADSLAVQVELKAPSNGLRRDVFSAVRASRDASPAEYQLVLQPEGDFILRDRSTGVALSRVSPGTTTKVGGLELRLSSGAAQYRSIEFDVHSFADAVELLQRGLSIERRKREANIIDVTYKGTDPQVVRDVPNALASRFITGRQSEHHAESRSTAKFLREQIEKLSTKLRDAERSLRTFREQEGVVSLPDEASSGVTRAAELEAKRTSIEAERVALSELLRTTQDSAAADPGPAGLGYRRLVAFPTLLRDQAMAGLLGSASAIEDRRTELLSRRSPQDPDVQNLSARAVQLGEQIRAMAVTYVEGLTNQVAALDSALGQSREQLSRIPQKELRFARLQRDANGLEEIVNRLQSRLKEAEIAEAVEDPSIRLVDAAALPRKPVSPKPFLNLGLALVLGVMLGTSGAVLWEHMDRTVRSRHDMLIATGVPVLGLLPRAGYPGRWRASLHLGRTGVKNHAIIGQRVGRVGRNGQPAASAGLIRGNSALSLVEAYNLLDTNLAFARTGAPTKVLAITSPLPGEGKTTVAVNLALTLARRGLRVLLVDADLRRGMIAPVFGIAEEPGVSDILLGMVHFGKAARSIAVTETGRLDVISRGSPSGNPAQLLGSTEAHALLESLRAEYDSVIVDTPPVNVVADASVLAVNSDGVIVVARAGVTEAPALAFAMDQLYHVRAPVVGAVLNDIDFRRDAIYDEACRYYARGDAYAQHVG